MHKVELPKWPQMRVIGKPITEEQAIEIIRRTDTFIKTHGLYNSNDENGDILLMSAIGFKKWNPSDKFYVWENDCREFDKKWGTIDCKFVYNSWLSTSFVGGPTGWCHPTGEIYFEYNIGKWPTIEEVYNDWCKIAIEFPFLELDAVLYQEEQGYDGDNTPLIRINLKNSLVKTVNVSLHGLGLVEKWEPRDKDEDYLSFLKDRHPDTYKWVRKWQEASE